MAMAARQAPELGTSSTLSPSAIHLVLHSRQMTLRLPPKVEIVLNDWQNGQ
jgi:hypothetical protein